MFGRVHDEVLKSTGRKQEPFTYGALGGVHIYLVPPTSAEPAAPTPAPSAAIDRDALFWSSVRNSKSKRIIQTYLNKFPEGQFAELARIRIDIINQQAEAKRQTIGDKPLKETRLLPATASPSKPALAPAKASAFELFLAGNKSARNGDHANAAQNWLWAAEQGHADAAFKLGRLFERGLGKPKSIADAKNWYAQAKDMGSSRARKALARLGGAAGSSAKTKLKKKKPASNQITSTSADREAAKKALAHFFAGNSASRQGQHERAHASWRMAANLGHHDAAFKLGEAFRKGKGVQRSVS
ncbi:MAG: sel1 repeat family protein, partial [Rhizobiales bacterium]|nr:sel1 repeat family protein [Hyphomicrobiales bacterium]